ncbi:MAG TPA: HTH domain-containing protein [Candidatus Glassbacteria bacterium]|nr:HTH domain-containing protein [Candidatus Glassbacteria bacterium]
MNKKTSTVTKNTKTPTAIRKPKQATSRKISQTKDVKLTTARAPRINAKTAQKIASAVKNRRTIVDVCIGIFTKNENRPMYVKNIYSAMRQRHWRTSGKTPQQTISSKLNADYRFVRVSPNTFKMDDTFYSNRVKNIKS